MPERLINPLFLIPFKAFLSDSELFGGDFVKNKDLGKPGNERYSLKVVLSDQEKQNLHVVFTVVQKTARPTEQ